MKQPLEHDIQKQILEYLAYKHIYCWRNNSGAVITSYVNKAGQAKKRMFSVGKKGSSDIIGILPDGRFLAIEVKRKGGKPTPEQEEFLAEINKNKGVAFIATSVEEVIDKLNYD